MKNRLTRDGTTETRLARPNSRARTGTGGYSFLCSADYEQDWQPYPVDQYSAIFGGRRYIIYIIHTHTYCRVTNIARRVWINRARLPRLLVVRWTRKMNISLSAFAPQNLVSRDGFGSPVPRQPAHLHTETESGAYLRDSSQVQRRRPFTYLKPPYAIGTVPSLSRHAIAYRWRSLPIVCRHRASKPQGNFERLLPCQVTMDQLICALLSHTHYWYEVGMLKVPAIL